MHAFKRHLRQIVGSKSSPETHYSVVKDAPQQNDFITNLTVWFLVFSVLNYTFLYQFEFSQGTSKAPLTLFVIKDLISISFSIVLFIYAGLKRAIERLYQLWPLTLVVALIGVTSLHKTLLTGDLDYLLEIKNLILAFPIALLGTTSSFDKFWTKFHYLFGFQASIWLLENNGLISLWEGSDFSGTIGNPNTMGFFLNMYLLFLAVRSNQNFLLRLSLFVLASFLLIWTRSASQQALAVVLLSICFLESILRKNNNWLWLFIYLSIALPIGVTFNRIPTHVYLQACTEVSKKISLNPLLIGCPANFDQQLLSLSISDRISKIKEVDRFLRESSVKELAFGRASEPYFKVDGQFFSVLVNHGIITFVALLFLLGTCTVFSFRSGSSSRFLFPSIILVCISFVFARKLHYFPASIFIYMIFAYALSGKYTSGNHIEIPSESR